MGQLGINLPELIYQIVNFGILAVILYLLLYKRVLNMLNERTTRIEQGLKEADQVKQQLANARRDYDAEIAKARREAAAILSQAQERAKAQEEEIVAQARQEGERIRAELREQAQQERDQMLREVKGQVAELVTLTASRVLQAELANRGHDQLIEESLDALGRQN
jgi:F-type H+-transporting ATPase subunit b